MAESDSLQTILDRYGVEIPVIVTREPIRVLFDPVDPNEEPEVFPNDPEQ